MSIEIEVNGHRVEVDDSFANLSPEQQQAQVNEIASMLPKTAEETKTEQKVASDLYSTPGVAALGGAALGMIDQALGQPIETLVARRAGAEKLINPATGEHAGWKWARKTGFGAGLDPTVEGQSTEFQRREAEGKFKQKPGQVRPIPGKALTLEKHLENVARDEMEARIKAQAAAKQAPGYTSTKPTSMAGKGLGLAGRMVAGAGALGMGKQAYDEGAKALERFKAGDIGGAARAGRGALLNALGAAGSAATYVPHPLVRGIGTAVGIGAPALNLLLEQAGYAAGGLAHFEGGGSSDFGTREGRDSATVEDNRRRMAENEMRAMSALGAALGPLSLSAIRKPMGINARLATDVYGVRPYVDVTPSGRLTEAGASYGQMGPAGGYQLNLSQRAPVDGMRSPVVASGMYRQPVGRAGMLDLQGHYVPRQYDMPQSSYGAMLRYTTPFAEGGHTTPAWQRKEGQNPEGGLNAAGRASYHRETGGTLKPPVTAKEAKSSPKKAARRKSFCARMSGVEGPMKDESGKPTRKALSLRKWEC